LPSLLALRDELNQAHQYDEEVRIGLGGGIATPTAAAAAFTLGAACVLTGSVNQACVEAGTSQIVREMLAAARQVDVTMTPSADLFERGGQVQVLKRGTAFALRARKLYELYCAYDSLESLPLEQKTILEQDFFRHTLEEEWSLVRNYFDRRDRRQIQRAESDPRHKLALIFRSYIGQASTWAIAGDTARKTDYQIWCGPAMGGFNEWVKGSFLEEPDQRRVKIVALNLLFGAAVVIRAGWLRMQGITLPSGIGRYRPLPLDALSKSMNLETTVESVLS
jgi:trans-AT polyketide synthase, acyltransferase and oxidoreductase domains